MGGCVCRMRLQNTKPAVSKTPETKPKEKNKAPKQGETRGKLKKGNKDYFLYPVTKKQKKGNKDPNSQNIIPLNLER